MIIATTLHVLDRRSLRHLLTAAAAAFVAAVAMEVLRCS